MANGKRTGCPECHRKRYRISKKTEEPEHVTPAPPHCPSHQIGYFQPDTTNQFALAVLTTTRTYRQDTAVNVAVHVG